MTVSTAPDRAAGWASGPSGALVDLARRSQAKASLRSLAVTDPSQIPVFDEEFERFFAATSPPLTPQSLDVGVAKVPRRSLHGDSGSSTLITCSMTKACASTASSTTSTWCRRAGST